MTYNGKIMEIWTHNEVHYLMVDEKAICWDENYHLVRTMAQRLADPVPMIPEFKSFLPAIYKGGMS